MISIPSSASGLIGSLTGLVVLLLYGWVGTWLNGGLPVHPTRIGYVILGAWGVFFGALGGMIGGATTGELCKNQRSQLRVPLILLSGALLGMFQAFVSLTVIGCSGLLLIPTEPD